MRYTVPFHQLSLRHALIRIRQVAALHLALEHGAFTVAQREMFQQKSIGVFAACRRSSALNSVFISLETVEQDEILQHDPKLDQHLVLSHIGDGVAHGNGMRHGRKGRGEPESRA